MSKIAANYLLVTVSLALGYFVSYLYVNIYFTKIPLLTMIIALFIYLVWILFIVSFMTMLSTIFKNQALIGIMAIPVLIFCNLINGLHPMISILTPASMSHQAIELLVFGSIQSTFIWSLLVNIGWISLTIWVTHYWINNKKFGVDNG